MTPATPLQRLRQTVEAFGATGYALLDGAQFPDLPGALRTAGLSARSLFFGQGDVATEAAGPWLVPLAQSPAALEGVMNTVGEVPAAVFWSSVSGELELYRHLRTLNKVRIPEWAAAGGTMPPADGTGTRPEAVLLRHWDPNVLGALLPVLDAGQFARVLGPAAEITLVATEHEGLQRVVADPDWPIAPSGMMSIRPEQLVALSDRRAAASRRRIAAYLRTVAPAETAGAPDQAVLAHVRESEATGLRLGLQSEEAHARWAFIMCKSNGRVLRMPEVLRFIREGSEPDRQVKLVMVQAIGALRGQAGPGG